MFRVHAREKHKYCSEECFFEAKTVVAEENLSKIDEHLNRILKHKAHICIYCGKKLQDNKIKYKCLCCDDNCVLHYYRKVSSEQRQKNSELIKAALYPKDKHYCPNCGEKIVQTHRGRKRIYCNPMCAVQFKRREEVEMIRELAYETKVSEIDMRVDDFAISLWLQGHNRASIAEALGMKYSTLKTWIYKYKNPDKKYSHTTEMKIKLSRMPIDYAYKYAQTSDEWIKALRDKTRGIPYEKSEFTGNKSVYLMCGKINIGKRAANISEIVSLKLGLNPFEGGVFAFSGGRFETVKCIFYDGRGLCSLQYNRTSGSYPWPSPKLGNSILVSAKDFERLLCCGNRYRNNLSWDDIGLEK
jgi:transposase